jgi:glycosyltransferase involved in cell wall biosynthesis
LKILFLNSFYAPDIVGGAEVVLQSLVEGIASQGIDVAVLTTTDQSGLHRDEVNGVPVWRAGVRNIYWHKPSPLSRSFLARQFWRLIDIYNPFMRQYISDVVIAEKPTVASVHNLAGWSASAWSALLHNNIPIVQILHDYQLMCRGLMFKAGIDCRRQCLSCNLIRHPHKRISAHISGVVGVSHSVLNRLLDAGYFKGVLEKRVIYNSRTRDELNGNHDASRHNMEHTPLRFGYIGALAQHKGVELLVRSFVQAAIPDTELYIAGTGDTAYTERLKEIARISRVRFLGQVHPAEFFLLADVIVVPSLWNEPLATVVIEAMAFGKPVIASAVGGNPEMIIDGVNGIIFDPNHPDQLISAIQRLKDDHILYEHMSRETVQRSRLFTDRLRFVRQHLEAYCAAEQRH